MHTWESSAPPGSSTFVQHSSCFRIVFGLRELLDVSGMHVFWSSAPSVLCRSRSRSRLLQKTLWHSRCRSARERNTFAPLISITIMRSWILALTLSMVSDASASRAMVTPPGCSAPEPSGSSQGTRAQGTERRIYEFHQEQGCCSSRLGTVQRNNSAIFLLGNEKYKFDSDASFISVAVVSAG